MDMFTEDYNSVKSGFMESVRFRWQQGDRKGLMEEAFELKFREQAGVFQSGR